MKYIIETNSKKTIKNVLENEYKLGVIRYAESYDKYYKTMLEEKGLACELVAEFSYVLIMSRENPLASKDIITYEDLSSYIEIAHADPYAPSVSMSKVFREEFADNIGKRIFVFERASQFDLLSENPSTFMWVSPASDKVLERYGLVMRQCEGKKKTYKDVLIYHKGYKLSKLDKDFITALCDRYYNLWEGRYTPTVNGKRMARNVYAHTEEEFEEKLAQMINEMKIEIEKLKQGG